jgi:hypothetical protein
VIRPIELGARLRAGGLVNSLRFLQEDGVVDLRAVEGRLDGWVVDELREEGFAVVAEADAAGFDFLLRWGLVVGGWRVDEGWWRWMVVDRRMAYQHCLVEFYVFCVGGVELEDPQEVLQGAPQAELGCVGGHCLNRLWERVLLDLLGSMFNQVKIQ